MTHQDTYVGVDLGGARGKTTALAIVRAEDEGAIVEEVSARAGGLPWTDDILIERLVALRQREGRVIVAIDAPLTSPACVRCTLEACPGVKTCEVPAVAWLRTRGAELLDASRQAGDRIAAVPRSTAFREASAPVAAPSPLAPYTHRCAEVVLHFEDDLISRDQLGRSSGPRAARAQHLRRVLVGHGFVVNRDLIEVSPRATIRAIAGERLARSYKRDADPWLSRATIVDTLSGTLEFGKRSRLAREDVLGNDHCFDALISAYTAYRFAKDGWTKPEDPVFDSDGWIWVPR